MGKRTIVTASGHTSEFTRHSEGDVVELDDGRLLLVYMEFSGDGSDVAPTRIASLESNDGGLTWGGRHVLTETARCSTAVMTERPGERLKTVSRFPCVV